MAEKPTTLSDVIRLIAEVLEQHYGIDPQPLIEESGVDGSRAELSGSRVEREAVMRLWDLASEATGDPSVGLAVGARVRPTTFYALSLGFMTCDNLRASLELLCRYFKVIATVPVELHMSDEADSVRLSIRYTNPAYPLPPLAFDSFLASIIGLCRLATRPDFTAERLELAFPDNGRAEDYASLFGAPVVYEAATNALFFSRAELEAPLPGRSADLLHASDRILADYVDALNPDAISSEVRRLLLHMLSSGQASQDAIAEKLHMSRSTLQRRLQQENTNYRDLLEDTRRSLAVEYVREGKHPLSYVAFLLGFSDQSNFSRAFRRWTGMSPKAFQEQRQQ